MSGLLSHADKTRVQQAIAEVERRTAGEIVTIVAARSAPYDDWRALLTGILTVLSALVVYLSAPSIVGVWVIAGQVPLAFAFWWLVGTPAILRRIVPSEVKAQAVSARAREVFIEHGLTETRDRSGVLLMVSELERRVEILADKGIHERVGIDGWKGDVDDIVQAIRSGQTADGLCRAVRRIGDELAEAFPSRPDDINELSNEVVRVD